MARDRVVVSCPVVQDLIDDYADRFSDYDVAYEVRDVDQQLSEAELLEIVDDYDGILAGDDPFTRRVIESADRLRVISKWGVGIDNIDEAAAAEHGITVTRTPGLLGEAVADVVFGYAIMLARDLHHIDRAVREGTWATPRGISMSDATFGVVGLGDAGSAVARRAGGFGMEILGTDVQPFPEPLVDATDIADVDLDELFDRSDFVSINCALTAATESMIGPDELDRLGPDGYLINTARGEILDQDALITALAEGRIAGAALDVYETEPLPDDSPLREFDTVLLGTHNAQNTHAAVERVTDRAVENLLSSLVESRDE